VRTRTKGCGRVMRLGERAKRPSWKKRWFRLRAKDKGREFGRDRVLLGARKALLLEMYVCMIPDDRQDLHYTIQERVWNNNR
jgi:hypothetical protein